MLFYLIKPKLYPLIASAVPYTEDNSETSVIFIKPSFLISLTYGYMALIDGSKPIASIKPTFTSVLLGFLLSNCLSFLCRCT